MIGGRLNDRVSISQAAAELDVIGRALEREYPENRQTGLRLLPSSRVPGNRGPIVAFVALLTAIVSFVLITRARTLPAFFLRAQPRGGRRWRCVSR